MSEQLPYKSFRWTSSAGVFAGIVLSGFLSWLLLGTNSGTPTPPPTLPEPSKTEPRDPRLVAQPHLVWAANRCLAETSGPIEQIQALFREARANSRAFAENALGWDSKLTIVSDFFQQTDEHSAFLRRKFEQLVISEAALLSALEQGITQYQHATASIEGQMLVRLRADASDFSSSPLVSAADVMALQTLFQQALAKSGSAAGFDLQAAVGRELASYILGEIAAQVGVPLGVSSGILSAGAATGWTNFGISLVLGLAIDQMVTAGYDAVLDPKGKLAEEINAVLDEMEELIIEGTDLQPGLRSRLQNYARERSSMRETAVLRLLTPAGGAL